MKVALFSTTDRTGGAAIAAHRLLRGLRETEVRPEMYVLRAGSPLPLVRGPVRPLERIASLMAPKFDALFLRLGGGGIGTPFSPGVVNGCVIAKALREDPAVINLHWINAGCVSIESLRRVQRPIVWTIHDMWPFTGGCHYSEGCRRFEDRCGRCPQLRSAGDRDLSSRIHRRKVRHWQSLDLTIVTPSRWLAQEAAASSLFRDRRIEVIPNGLDLERFRPVNQAFARDVLGLPQDKKLLLFSAWSGGSDRRKGFDLLEAALAGLVRDRGFADQVEVVLIGSGTEARTTLCGLRCRGLGSLNDDISLSLAYNAVDAFVAPSRQDNLPNTVVEALACGTPTVAFHIGGMPDIIQHKQHGYLAQPFDTNDLAEGIKWALWPGVSGGQLRSAARTYAEQRYALGQQARSYAGLFAEVNRPGAT